MYISTALISSAQQQSFQTHRFAALSFSLTVFIHLLFPVASILLFGGSQQHFAGSWGVSQQSNRTCVLIEEYLYQILRKSIQYLFLVTYHLVTMEQSS